MCYPLLGYMQRHPHAESQKHACPLPAGIKVALSCTVCTYIYGDYMKNMPNYVCVNLPNIFFLRCHYSTRAHKR